MSDPRFDSADVFDQFIGRRPLFKLEMDIDGDWAPQEQELIQWWVTKAAHEATSCAMKSREYGTVDLQVLGDALVKIIGRCPEQVNPTELGLAFYLQGKVSRLVGAYADGRRPSDDTLHDTAIYTRMIQRLRERGQYP